MAIDDDDTVALKQIIRLLMGCFYASCDCSYGNDVVVQIFMVNVIFFGNLLLADLFYE